MLVDRALSCWLLSAGVEDKDPLHQRYGARTDGGEGDSNHASAPRVGCDVISIGVPLAAVSGQRVVGSRLIWAWVGLILILKKAFACPTKMMNDAAMQAYGSYREGTMLFLGFGTGLGTALIVDGFVVSLEGGHLPYDKTQKKFGEDFVGKAGRKRLGDQKWLKHSFRIIESLSMLSAQLTWSLEGATQRILSHYLTGCDA